MTETGSNRFGRRVCRRLARAFLLCHGFFRAAETMALYQVAWAEIVLRLLPKGRLVRIALSDGGPPISLRAGTSDADVYRQIMLKGEYPVSRPWLRDRYEAILARGAVPLIVDAGSNVGLFARRAAIAFPRAQVVAIEPSEESIALARLNCAGLSNVSFRHAALWRREGRVVFVDSRSEPWGLSCRDTAADEQGQIESVTLDSVLAAVPKAEPLLLKVDIEGAEKQALVPGAAFWRSCPAVFIEPHDWMGTHRQTLSGLLAIPVYREAVILLNGENLLFFPTAGVLGAADRAAIA